MRFLRWLLPLILSAGAAAGFAQVPAAQAPPQGRVTLRIAANLPPNSPWDLGLRRLAREFDRISSGRVQLAFPPSARMGSEEDSIRRMRLGEDGAMVSSQGLAELYPDSLVLSLPGYITDEKEFDAVLAAMKPFIRAKLADRYALLALSKGGWIRFFSNSPIRYPSDLAGLRISVEQGNDVEARLLESVGARLVRGSIGDFLLQTGSGGVDGIFQSPIYMATLWFQLRGKLSYMSGFRVAPFLGAMVVNRASWEKVPAELKGELERAVQASADEVAAQTAALETEAMASLDGIRVVPTPADAQAAWARLIADSRVGLMERMFSSDILDALDGALMAARSDEKMR